MQEDLIAEHTLLGHLMTVNTGLGHAMRHMLDYRATHGHLPGRQLQTLAGLLREIAGELDAYADKINRPVVDLARDTPE